MKKASDEDDPVLSDQWYEQHPVVSTVLWLIGGITKSPELPSPKSESGKIPRTNSRLSWKDEHDGEIAEYISHDDKRNRNVESKEKKEKKQVSIKMPRQKSLAEVGSSNIVSTDSGDDNIYLRSGSGSSSSDDEDDKGPSVSLQEPARGGGDSEMDENTMSPQWGWYVSTTPPQELYGKSGSGKSSVP
mmetsp:Transcript_24109/g.40960  ORF Transcript_24109/g.40960 Transcript_24109/m.40960 type:complete len:188 (-) Transcript_24109:464-1027(-)|eukprot:CAMPEP_0114430780 /NCGR_PEP_ID=MMETSP0103-20121206/10227_1 /TAXON_ID=37642 ORGANISM="Paraphysomonas imperforata, Strain PA2" /NCGR_SAMPLE_ID=MMETSP0103 /ASSEMBLY_ACC=CAM_ASM_000201 /LENGTH=187 /DNA_ID=CAMNT_0001600257 /DNA_START=140 /DNA_END=706 /DNA_ORIENTATION=+